MWDMIFILLHFSKNVTSFQVLGETKCFFIQNKKNKKAHVKGKDEQNADQHTKAVGHTEHVNHSENTVQDMVVSKMHMNESKSDKQNHDNLTDNVREDVEGKADSDKANSVQSMEHHSENSVVTKCLNTEITAISSAEAGSIANMKADISSENQVSASEGTEVPEVKLYAKSYSASYKRLDCDSKSDSASNTKLDCNSKSDSASNTMLDSNSKSDSKSNPMLDCDSKSSSTSITKSDFDSTSDSASNTKSDCDSNMDSDSKPDPQCSVETTNKDQLNSRNTLKCNKTSSNQLQKSFVQNGATEVNERKLLSHPSIRFSKQYYPSWRSEVPVISSRRRINSAESDSKQSIYQHFTLTKRQLSLDSGFHDEDKNQKPVQNLEFPFPVQLFNEHKIKAGMKLGLYDKKTLENLEKSLKRKSLKKKMPSLRVE
jgi:hypothetical protein